MEHSDDPIVVEQTFRAPLDAVWAAITDPRAMRAWFFSEIEEFRAEAGFETSFDVHVEGRDYRHVWKLMDVQPCERIVFDWRYGGEPGQSLVTWELSESADGTRMQVTHDGVESHPQSDPAFHREAGEAGWRYFIRESLARYLQNEA